MEDSIRNALITVWGFLQSDYAHGLVWAILIALVGILLARLSRRWLALPSLHPQHRLLLSRFVSYGILGISTWLVLKELGVDPKVLLGAAGILTVAAGFAAQTSTSNIISGIFLMGEQPFKVGDIVAVNEVTGTVVSIDLLSVKLRTFDNLLVRIPNETMLKSDVTNMTYYPVRRFDMKIRVAYTEEVERVRGILMTVADANPICLTEPQPLILFLGFGESSLEFQFSVWSTRENYIELRNRIQEDVKKAFDAHGVEFPFPHRKLIFPKEGSTGALLQDPAGES